MAPSKDALKEAEEKGIKKGRRQGLKEGKKKGFEEGRDEGLSKGLDLLAKAVRMTSHRIASRMFARCVDIEIISETTGLTVKKLKNKFKIEELSPRQRAYLREQWAKFEEEVMQ